MATILAIVDDDDVRQTVQGLLEAAGFAITIVHSGVEAIAVLERSTPSLILAVPMTGQAEIVRILSADPGGRRIPRLVVTRGYRGLEISTSTSERRRFEWGQLIATVRELCGQAR